MLYMVVIAGLMRFAAWKQTVEASMALDKYTEIAMFQTGTQR